MVDLGQYSTIRQARKSDEYQLKRLLQRKATLHRHLGWHHSLFWLGKQPFFVQEDTDGTILSALACPADDAGLIWLRLFAVLPGYPVQRAWQRLWEPARDWLAAHGSGSEVNTLATNPELESILTRSGFSEISRVVSLSWDVTSASWPSVREDPIIREMTLEDISEVSRIDQAAFQPLWQNTPDQLRAALGEAFYASIVLVDGLVRGYQISTLNPQGGHLARLAVEPGMQGQGLGVRLLDDLLERLTAEGIVEVSVNTQMDNHSSLALYRKFGFLIQEDSYPVLRYRV